MPRETESGVQSGSVSSSAKQKVYLPGLPCIARSISPGRPPPTLRMMSWKARPMVALARLPWPSAFRPQFMPMRRATGPFTTMTGPAKWVVQSRPCMEKPGISAASTAASTVGKYSGRQPDMTALMAAFSTVQGARLGGISPMISSAARVVPASIRATRRSVGGTIGRPSVQPRSNAASIGSS